MCVCVWECAHVCEDGIGFKQLELLAIVSQLIPAPQHTHTYQVACTYQ